MGLSTRLSDAATTARRIWALSAPYFRSEDKWRARGLLAAIILLNLAVVFMLVQINTWYGVFYNALEKRDQGVFWAQLWRFTWLALIYIVFAVYRLYLTQLLEMRWREWMTRRYMNRWLEGQAFYRLELARFAQGVVTPASGPAGASATAGTPGQADNPDQRMQEDIKLFTTYSVDLSMGLLNAVVTLASFVGILWSLSGAFSFHLGATEYTIPGFMVWMTVLYCLVGSVLTHVIGRPLIRLNFSQQKKEADYRHRLVRVREYSEAIALDHGEPVEKKQLDGRFTAVIANFHALVKATKNLSWFSNIFGQAAVVFPFIVSAPRFFSGAIQLGQLMQIASAFEKVQDSLSWLVDNYSSVAVWRATADRLTGFEAALTEATEQKAQVLQPAAGDSLEASGLSVQLPGGRILLGSAAFRVTGGDTVVVQGTSGSGKSTLFRTMAGIWPHATGSLTVPSDAMFIPQRPYFPEGRLRDALAYPEPSERYSDADLRQALTDAELPALADQLDSDAAWSQKLSGGEQQRLAIARVLLKKPAWVFADEATSALDEPAEKAVYEKLLAQVRSKGGGLVSIAHRPSVAGYHQRRIVMGGGQATEAV